MKKIFGIFKQGWFISLLGMLALALIIWFIGPLFAFAGFEPLAEELHRWIAIAIVLFAWLAKQAWKFVNAKRENNQVMAGMVATPAAASAEELASQEELQALQERLHKALDVLKHTRLGGRWERQFLYQLPWYMLIGPPGSGKTTLLANSDLKFPLAERFGKEAIRGVGGTRNCDWWFAEDAVLLDTAGRYTTQDSNAEVDRAAWLGFLDLLKKHRRRRPLNGAIVAVSISDLLELNEADRQAHSQAIRKRIEELYENLNVRFPVYLLFTKCDLLAGFMEYFDDLDREGRAQVWGATFPYSEDPQTDPLGQFENEFTLLEQRLQDRLIEKLERERNGERRNLIYTFPQQYSALKSLITQFSREIFESTRYQYPVMLRGIYFTSATQEGSPIDRIMGSLINRFGLDRQSLSGASGSGKSFFINHLLNQVVFAESGLAGTNLRLENKRAWLQRGAVAATLVSATLAGVIWAFSYSSNVSYIDDTAAQATELQQFASGLHPEQSDVLAVLPLLDKARNLPAGYTDRAEGHNRALTFGLYQGDKLGDAAESTYRRLLKDAFLPPLMMRLEQQIQDNAHSSEFLYEALKVYLMLGDSAHYNADAIRTWITLDWDSNLPLDVTNEQRQALANHLSTLLETRPAPLPRPLDARIVEQTRDILARAPLAERVYSRLKTELAQAGIPEFRLSDAAGRDAPLVFTRKSGKPLSTGVPGLFTYAGYHDYFLPASKRLSKQLADESWIFGQGRRIEPTGDELQSLREDVHKRYLDEYARQWHALLADVRIVPFRNLEEAVQVLNVLSSERSPLRLLLEAVTKETALDRVSSVEKGLMDKAEEQLQAAKSRLGAIIGQTPNLSSTPGRPEIGPHIVSQQFKELHELVESPNGQPPAVGQILAMLNELYVYLNPLVNASGDEMVLEQRKQITNALQKVQTEAKRQPSLVSDLLNDSTKTLGNIVAGGVCEHLNAVWKSEVLAFYNKAVSGRYPIHRGATREITQEDFGQFFGPGGILEQFFKTYLAASVDKSGRNWRWISRDKSPACASSATLRQFKRAEIIRNTFFRSAGPTPSVGFKLKPLSMSSDINRLNLDVDGQKLSYAHEQPRVTPMKWPGPNNAGQVSLQFSPPLMGGTSGLNFEGPWALFRLFDEASLTQIGNTEQFRVAFNLQGRAATFELRASSAFNPFKLQELLDFRCPPRL